MPEASASAPRQSARTATSKPQTRDLTQGPIASTLLVFALPILAGNVLQSLNGSVNAIWVGGHLGEAALTATANANNVMFALIGAVFGISMATNILIAQSMGAKNIAQAKRAWHQRYVFGVVSLLIALLGWPLSRHLMQWMSTPEGSAAAGRGLSQGHLSGHSAAVHVQLCDGGPARRGRHPNAVLVSARRRGAGHGAQPAADLWLGPVPRMGIQGSAVATLIANAVSFLPCWAGCVCAATLVDRSPAAGAVQARSDDCAHSGGQGPAHGRADRDDLAGHDRHDLHGQRAWRADGIRL
jgi:hypothetical protein